MTSVTGAADPAAASRPVRWWRLVLAHAGAHALVWWRSPAQLLFLLLAPAVALAGVVAPQRDIAGDPGQSAQAFAQMAVLGALSVSVFGLGISAAEERASPWSSFLRTLPVSGAVAIGARLAVTVVTVAGCLVPLSVAAVLTTALPQHLASGRPASVDLAAATFVAVAGAVPFLGLALAVGYSFTPSSAVAVAQVVVVPLALVGGLVLPPRLFPDWLLPLSPAAPTRATRDVLLWAIEAGPWRWSAVAVWVVWVVAALAVAGYAYARDEGRRFT